MENEKQVKIDSETLEKKILFYEKFANRFIIFGALLFLFGIVVFLIPHSYHDKFGAFGEFFGGIIGSIWSLAGIFLFYSALKNQSKEFKIQQNQLELQREELKLQRNELKLQRYETELQRKEFERQTQELKFQNQTLSVQKFENTFFHLLNLHNDIVSSNEDRDLGKKWAKTLYMRFIGNFSRVSEREDDLDLSKQIAKTYQIFPKRIEYLDRYFNNLTYMLQFIQKAKIEDKTFYVQLIRAQMTIHEQLFFFYFGLSDYSDFKTREILAEHYFFCELPSDELIDISHKEFYDSSCFQKPNIDQDQGTIDFANS